MGTLCAYGYMGGIACRAEERSLMLLFWMDTHESETSYVNNGGNENLIEFEEFDLESMEEVGPY